MGYGVLAVALSPFQRVPDVQKDLEVQLLAAISEVEGGHLGVVASGLGPLECFAVHVVDVGEDAFARAGHADLLDGLGSETGRLAGGTGQLLLTGLQQVALGGVEEVAARGKRREQGFHATGTDLRA